MSNVAILHLYSNSKWRENNFKINVVYYGRDAFGIILFWCFQDPLIHLHESNIYFLVWFVFAVQFGIRDKMKRMFCLHDCILFYGIFFLYIGHNFGQFYIRFVSFRKYLEIECVPVGSESSINFLLQLHTNQKRSNSHTKKKTIRLEKRNNANI